MAWTFKLSETAKKQLSKLDRPIAKRITRYFHERVLALAGPHLLGDSLTGDLDGYWRYRVGDYRRICELRDDELVIFLVKVAHRREVYK